MTKKEKETIKEILYATTIHKEAMDAVVEGRIDDVGDIINGLDITLDKLKNLLGDKQ